MNEILEDRIGDLGEPAEVSWVGFEGEEAPRILSSSSTSRLNTENAFARGSLQ